MPQREAGGGGDGPGGGREVGTGGAGDRGAGGGWLRTGAGVEEVAGVVDRDAERLGPGRAGEERRAVAGAGEPVAQALPGGGGAAGRAEVVGEGHRALRDGEPPRDGGIRAPAVAGAAGRVGAQVARAAAVDRGEGAGEGGVGVVAGAERDADDGTVTVEQVVGGEQEAEPAEVAVQRFTGLVPEDVAQVVGRGVARPREVLQAELGPAVPQSGDEKRERAAQALVVAGECLGPRDSSSGRSRRMTGPLRSMRSTCHTPPTLRSGLASFW